MPVGAYYEDIIAFINHGNYREVYDATVTDLLNNNEMLEEYSFLQSDNVEELKNKLARYWNSVTIAYAQEKRLLRLAVEGFSNAEEALENGRVAWLQKDFQTLKNL